jgi:hypothetical protein
VLTASILALSAYLEPSNSASAARVLRTTTASVMLITPTVPTRSADAPDVSQPKWPQRPLPIIQHVIETEHDSLIVNAITTSAI